MVPEKGPITRRSSTWGHERYLKISLYGVDFPNKFFMNLIYSCTISQKFREIIISFFVVWSDPWDRPGKPGNKSE